MSEHDANRDFWERHVCRWYGRGGLLSVLVFGNLWQIQLFLQLTPARVGAVMVLACGELVLISWLARVVMEVRPMIPVGRVNLGPINLPGELPLLLPALLALIWIVGSIFASPSPTN